MTLSAPRGAIWKFLPCDQTPRPQASALSAMSDHQDARPTKRAPTLYGIAAFKLGKGLIFLLFALGIYTLSDNDLPREFRTLIEWMRLDPGHEFFRNTLAKLSRVTEQNMLWVAGGTGAYAALAIVEGIGLLLRFRWAAYLAIAEGAFFIPIEVNELGRAFTVGMSVILVINVIIVVYLWRNRARLFRHPHPRGEQPHGRHTD